MDDLIEQELYRKGWELTSHWNEDDYTSGVLMLREAHRRGYKPATLALAKLPAHIDRSINGLSRSEEVSALLDDAMSGGWRSAVELYYHYNDEIDDLKMRYILEELISMGAPLERYLEELIHRIGR